MSYARYLQAIAKGLHDYVLPQLEGGQARDVLTNSLRALAGLASNLDSPPPELLRSLDGACLPAELAAVVATDVAKSSGLRLPTADPVDDFAMSGASSELITAGAQWFANTSWLSVPHRSTARSLLQWEHDLRTCAVGRIAEIERGHIGDDVTASADVPDISREALQAYLRQRLENPALEVSEFRFMPGGRVRQTALFSIQHHPGLPEKQVIQRDHPAGLTSFKGAPMQFALLERLHQAGMRVPRPLLMESSREALAGVFLIAERVSGTSPVPPMDYFVAPPRSEKLALDLARQLAILHTTPIGDLEPVLNASLDAMNPTWASDAAKMEAAWNANAHAPSMAVSAAFAWMRAHADQIPERRTIVHGDLLLHNILVDGEEVSAVLDWEAAHLGHPAEDLGYLRPVIEQMTGWNRFLDAYVAAGGRRPSPVEVDFFTLRSLTTLSVWIQYARAAFEGGRTSEINMAEVGAAFLPKLIHRLGQQVLAVLERS